MSRQRASSVVYANVYTVDHMSRPTKKSRGIRVTDAVWDAAMAEAKERGEFLNEAIDRFLVHYANGGDVTKRSSR